jgi:S-formylglutathione hydrolase FrmB
MLEGPGFAISEVSTHRPTIEWTRRRLISVLVVIFAAGIAAGILTTFVASALGTPAQDGAAQNASGDAAASADWAAISPIAHERTTTVVTPVLSALPNDCPAIARAVGYGVAFYPNAAGAPGVQSRQLFDDLRAITSLGCQGPVPGSQTARGKQLIQAITDADQLAWLLS